MDLKIFYTEKVEKLSMLIAARKAKSRKYIICEIWFFISFVGLFIWGFADGKSLNILFAALTMLCAYIIVRIRDSKNSCVVHELVCKSAVYEDEIKYINGDFSVFDDGEIYSNPSHCFAFDLDIFGKDSLYNRINRTVTSGGSKALAENLGNISYKDAASAIKELAENEPLRTNFIAAGKASKKKIDTDVLVKVLHDVKTMNIPEWAILKSVFIFAWIIIVGFYASVMSSLFGFVSINVPLWWGITQFFLVLLFCLKPLKMIMQATGEIHDQIKSYIHLIKILSEVDFQTELNKRVVRDLDGAIVSFADLEKIMKGLDRRANALGMFFFNVLFLSDFFLIRDFLKWQRTFMNRVGTWVNAVSDMDARVSMSVMRFNHPETTDAEVIEDDKIIYEADGLYHPFIGRNAVRNDFNIADHNYYIITGANMAGKSTFLRAVGINYVLAMNGMPVFANHLKVSEYNLFSSMRTTDDLAHGISYFNAELLRLRQLIDVCRNSKHTLIILDEILKGTNSLDKLNGSRLFLESISQLPVSGIIATHDLELSNMTEKNASQFHNYCFEIELGEKVTYSYKITPGVARNQNATYLLKQILQ